MKVLAGLHSFLEARILFSTLRTVVGMQFLAVVTLSFLFVGGCQLETVLRATQDFLPHGPLPLETFTTWSSLLKAQLENLSVR